MAPRVRGGYIPAVPLPLQDDPRLVPFAPAARRAATVFGAPVELVLVPERARRGGRATADRPAFARCVASRIVREEALWREQGLVLTANRYPFARAQRVLWHEHPGREPDARTWRALFEWTDGTGGAALHNTIGAAATVGRAHAHLLVEHLPFLDLLPEARARADLADLPDGVELVQKHVPFALLGVRGPRDAAAATLVALAEARLTPAWNVVVQRGTAWLYARSRETPAPHFPYALGAAELWGRWCFTDAAAFAAADGAALERALVAAGTPPVPPAPDSR